MLKGTRPKATWNDDDVIRAQRLGDRVGHEAEASVIRDFLCKGADLPIELRYEVHRLETRERIINADQVQSCHPVENNECRFHGDLPVEHAEYLGVVRGAARLCRGILTLKIIYLTAPKFFKFSISIAEKPKSFIISSVCSLKSGALD